MPAHGAADAPTATDNDAGGGVDYDLLIVGGGLVGASLAVALAPAGLSLAVVEAVAVPAGDNSGDSDAERDNASMATSAAQATGEQATSAAQATGEQATSAEQQPSFDERTVALTYNARQIYTALGVWERMAPHAQPIREIHVSERGHFGMTHLRGADVGLPALGYVLPARAMGQILHRRLRRSAAKMYCPAAVKSIRAWRRHAEVTLSAAGGSTTVTARLVVLADGGRSALGAAVGIATQPVDYAQSAVVSMVRTDRAHHGRAYERFTAHGPLALLPYRAQRYAVAWTTAQSQTAARLARSDAAFIADLQATFGDRAGTFSAPTARRCYPLARATATSPVAARVVAIGDAAHRAHPVAGQGFNLGLRDVAALAQRLQHAAQHGADLGAPTLLADYAAARRRETQAVGAFTDGLVKMFCHRNAAVALARNLALAGIEYLPPAKRLLLRRTMGMAGQHSGLGAGQPLR